MYRDLVSRARGSQGGRSASPRRRFGLLTVVIAMAVLVAACSGPGGNATPTPTAAIVSTASPIPATPTRAAVPSPTPTRAPRVANTPTATRSVAGTAARSTGTAFTFRSPGQVGRAGLAEQTITALAAHASDPQIIYAGAKGVSQSTDGGQNWTSVLSERQAPRVATIAMAPSNHQIIYVGVSEGCAKGGSPMAGFVSDDSGENWRETGGNLNAVAIDPRNARLAYAATCRGVERTTDLGETWEVLAGARIDNYEPAHIAIAPSDPQTIYVLYASEGGGIRARRSENGGTSWQDATPAGEPFGPIGLTVDATDARVVYFSAATGVYRSKNGGRAWDRLTEGLEATVTGDQTGTRTNTAILADPLTADLVWLGTGTRAASGSGIYHSTNQGGRWRQLTDFEGRAVHMLALGGHGERQKLYVATEDGVWVIALKTP